MIDREKVPLQSWIAAIASKGVARRNEEQQAVRKNKDAWKRRCNEDAKYLRQSGALRIFENSVDTLQGITLNVLRVPRAGIVKPSYDEKQKEAHIRLIWNEEFNQARDRFEYCEILCFVAREEGVPQGVRISGIEEVIPVDKEILGQQLLRSIQSAREKPRLTLYL